MGEPLQTAMEEWRVTRSRVHDIEVEIKPLVAPPSSPQSGR